jgi:hypothetical protein
MSTISTGLRNHLMGTGSFKNAMDLSYLKIYGSPAPTSPDSAVGAATLLCVVSVSAGATGVTFEVSAQAGLLLKAAAEQWQGNNVATGTAVWFRLVKTNDDGTASTTALRLQGTVALAGADLNLTATSLTSGAVQTVDYFSVLMPA